MLIKIVYVKYNIDEVAQDLAFIDREAYYDIKGAAFDEELYKKILIKNHTIFHVFRKKDNHEPYCYFSFFPVTIETYEKFVTAKMLPTNSDGQEIYYSEFLANNLNLILSESQVNELLKEDKSFAIFFDSIAKNKKIKGQGAIAEELLQYAIKYLRSKYKDNLYGIVTETVSRRGFEIAVAMKMKMSDDELCLDNTFRRIFYIDRNIFIFSAGSIGNSFCLNMLFYGREYDRNLLDTNLPHVVLCIDFRRFEDMCAVFGEQDRVYFDQYFNENLFIFKEMLKSISRHFDFDKRKVYFVYNERDKLSAVRYGERLLAKSREALFSFKNVNYKMNIDIIMAYGNGKPSLVNGPAKLKVDLIAEVIRTTQRAENSALFIIDKQSFSSQMPFTKSLSFLRLVKQKSLSRIQLKVGGGPVNVHC